MVYGIVWLRFWIGAYACVQHGTVPRHVLYVLFCTDAIVPYARCANHGQESQWYGPQKDKLSVRKIHIHNVMQEAQQRGQQGLAGVSLQRP